MISIGMRRSKLTQAMERIMCLSPYLRELITSEYTLEMGVLNLRLNFPWEIDLNVIM